MVRRDQYDLIGDDTRDTGEVGNDSPLIDLIGSEGAIMTGAALAADDRLAGLHTDVVRAAPVVRRTAGVNGLDSFTHDAPGENSVSA